MSSKMIRLVHTTAHGLPRLWGARELTSTAVRYSNPGTPGPLPPDAKATPDLAGDRMHPRCREFTPK